MPTAKCASMPTLGLADVYGRLTQLQRAAYKNQVVTYEFSGNGGKSAVTNDKDAYPITGYVLRKYVHPDDAWAGTGATRLEKPFPIIRYAEILLSYVEAINTSPLLIPSPPKMEPRNLSTETLMKSSFTLIRYVSGLVCRD